MNCSTKTQLEPELPVQEHSDSLDSAIAATVGFILSELPELNESVNRGQTDCADFIVAIAPQVDRLCEAALRVITLGGMSRDAARSVIQSLGFMVSAAEKHCQTGGKPKGWGLSRLGRAEEALLALATIAGHPPRDTPYTYWVWNNGARPLTFTGSEQEVKFNQVINASDRAFKETCELLREIATWRVPLDSVKASDLLGQAASKMAGLRDVFMSLMRRTDGPHSARALEPMFFMTEMRLYLLGYPVGGREWEGVSAANLASQMSVDFLIGTTDDSYFTHTRDRFEFFPEEERAVLEADMSGDSVLSVFLRTMGAPHAGLETCGELAFGDLVRRQSPEWLSSLVKYKSLVKASSHLTASHWSLIDNYLLKPSKQLANDAQSHMTVLPAQGTSGMSMEAVAGIREMRRNHKIASKLVECV